MSESKDTERKAKTPRKKEAYRAMQRNVDRAHGGLSRKVPRHLLPAVVPATELTRSIERPGHPRLAKRLAAMRGK